MLDHTTYANLEITDTEKVDLDSMVKICTGIHNEFIQSFAGLPIRVDETLEHGYYIAVSRDLYNEIVAKNIDSIECIGKGDGQS